MGACFIAGTLVATDAGLVAIASIAAGDIVYAYDEESGDVYLMRVLRTFEIDADELVHVTVNGEEIVCTNEHPFYSPVCLSFYPISNSRKILNLIDFLVLQNEYKLYIMTLLN